MKVCLNLLIIAICIFYPILANSYMPYRTHPLINTKALELATVDTYLKNKLSFTNGIKEIFNKLSVSESIAQGGTDEDNFPRGVYHFHDPTKDWQRAGILELGYSSLLWAQDHTSGVTPNCQQLNINCTDNSNPDWSWLAARIYFNDALRLQSKTAREENFAKTFYTLGRVMHLLADAAVPEHSRNDSHMILGSRYEHWEENRASNRSLKIIIDQNSAPAIDHSSITNLTHIDGYNPIFNFWDTAPGPGPGIPYPGLSEYTNYNFLSPGTIFNTYANPVNPQKISGYVEVVKDANYTQSDWKIYFSGKTSDNRPIKHLVTTKYLWDELEKVSPLGLNSSKFILDENCFDDYAAILVPKAVSYDAGLLNYFFRGDISLDLGGEKQNQFVIKNSGDEALTGKFALYYDDEQENRHPVTISGLSTKDTDTISISKQGQSGVIEFDLPTSELPIKKQKYTLVFRGEMGNEKDAVAGSVKRGWWREEWDNGLTGNHTWLHTGINLPDDYSTATNQVIDGKLVKENASSSDKDSSSYSWIRNGFKYIVSGNTFYCLEEYYDENLCVGYGFGTEFPIAMTKNTRIRVKVDEMSIDPPIPNQAGCDKNVYETAQIQGIRMLFNNGASIMFTVPGQAGNGSAVYLTMGTEKSIPVFETFENTGISFTEPLNLVSINIIQLLDAHCYPDGDGGHKQRMVVDYIRVED